MAMPGRSFSAGSQYRYGFNGKENDRDISNGAQDYGMRISDTRLGRFLTTDPLTKSYPWYTPYQFAGNTPIWAVDIDGGEPGVTHYDLTPILKIAWHSFKSWATSKPNATTGNAARIAVQNTSHGQISYTPETNWEAWLIMVGGAVQAHNNYGSFQVYEQVNGANGSVYKPAVKVVPAGETHVTTPTAETVAAATSSSTAEETEPQLLVGQYKDNKTAGMSADHIPSFASLKKQRQAQLGRDLSATEESALKENSLTLIVNTRLHQTTSQTYGGRNNQAVQTFDATNPLQAIRNNVNAYRPTLLSSGYTNVEIDGAIQRLSVPFLPPPATQQAPTSAPHH